MTRLEKYDLLLWGGLSLCVAGILIALHCAAGCGAGEGAARQAARSAVFVMQALCSDDMTVKECGDVMLQNATIVDQALDGGR